MSGIALYNGFKSRRAGRDELAIYYEIQAFGYFILIFTFIQKWHLGKIAFGIGIGIALLAGRKIDTLEKNDFENLLFNSFWGKSKHYPFWSDFIDNPEQRQKLESPNGRVELFATMDKRQISYFQMALDVEQQEFYNYMYGPLVQIKDERFSGREKPFVKTYTFILPEFKEGVSQLHGEVLSINTTMMMLHPTAPSLEEEQYLEYQPELTEQLITALNQAIEEKVGTESLGKIEDNGDNSNSKPFTFSVSLEHTYGFCLSWCYEPEPGRVVPKRLLTGLNSINHQGVIGMIDDKPKNATVR